MIALCTSLLLAFSMPEPQAAAPRMHTIEGEVCDALGELLPAADVWVTDPDEPEITLARGTTDGSGVFRIGRVPERASWIVHASAPGLCEDAVDVSPSDAFARLHLFDAATVRGQWLDAQGRPIAGATVITAFEVARVLRHTHPMATTDAEGKFAISGVPLGMIDVRAFQADVGLAAARVHVRGDTEVQLLPVRDNAAIEVQLQGLPADASRPRVTVVPSARGTQQVLPPEQVHGVVDRDGVWRTRNLPKWTYSIRVIGSGFAFTPASQYVQPIGQSALTFGAHVITTVEVSGKLVGEHGTPLSGVLLALRAADSPLFHSEAVTSADGSFTFATVLPPGSDCIVQSLDPSWVLDQPKEEGMRGATDATFAGWHEAKVDPDLPLSLRAALACSVEGQVRSGGRPLRFAEVVLESADDDRATEWTKRATVRTDQVGRYRFSGQHAVAGVARVSVRDVAGSVASDAFSFSAGAGVALSALDLPTPGVITGVVVDGAGQPLPGVRVWLNPWDLAAGSYRPDNQQELITDHDGRYRFPGVAPGGYFLQVLLTRPSASQTVPSPFELHSNETMICDLRF